MQYKREIDNTDQKNIPRYLWLKSGFELQNQEIVAKLVILPPTMNISKTTARRIKLDN